MSSSFHTLEEGMKITVYLMLLQEPFAFPTSCSLQPLRLRGGRSPLPPGAAPLRGRAANAGAAACPASSSLPKTRRGWGAWGRCAPAQAVRLSRGHASARWERGVPLAPAPPSDARGNGISPGRALPRTETQVAKDTLNSFISP